MIKFFNKNNYDSLFEMANTRKEKTGLPFNIYLSLRPRNKKENTFRVKFQNDYTDRFNPDNLINVIIDINTFEYSVKKSKKINLSDKEIELGVKYVKQNFKPIYDYWNGLIDSGDLAARSKKLT